VRENRLAVSVHVEDSAGVGLRYQRAAMGPQRCRN
jgi:hypothetical protein